MLYHLLIPGIQYEGETLADMERREKAIRKHNAKVDALRADWQRQQRTPMRSMIGWAKRHGLMEHNAEVSDGLKARSLH